MSSLSHMRRMSEAEGLNALLTHIETIARPLLIGIAGGSCSGKSTFAARLVQALETRGHTSLCLALDDYFRNLDDPALTRDAHGRPNLDTPGAYDVERLHRDVELLLGHALVGTRLEVPRYDIATNRRLSTPRLIEAAPILIVEGLFAIDLLSGVSGAGSTLKVFIEAAAEVRLARRLRRDTARFSVRPDVIEERFWSSIEPLHHQNIAPQAAACDMVLLSQDKPAPQESMQDLEKIYTELLQAIRPEDVFGVVPHAELPERLTALKAIYRQLALVAHPDRYANAPEAQEMATEAFGILSTFYEAAKRRLRYELYGRGDVPDDDDDEVYDFVITTARREYRVRSCIAEGDLSTVYAGSCVDGEGEAGRVVVKIIDDPEDNDLLRNELRILRALSAQPSRHSKHLPTLLDHFKTSDDQLGLILRAIDGHDLHSVREKYPNGVPQEHVVWIFQRALSVVGFAHKQGIVHGNIEPAHLMVRARDHNVFLIDWSYAALRPALTGEGFRVLNEDYSAPEVEARSSPTPASDLFSLARCMVFLLGGDPLSGEMPNDRVDARLQRFIRFFLLESPRGRAQDAWEMHAKLGRLREEILGPHRFIEFHV